ncbi:flagellar export apparatus, transmembrane gate complex, FlhA component [Candidatus Campylobacter infans]|uniref:Flagellar biosynthesis protein FlhA n=1 Tax=Candidatus Campylobacter infans TaxID=2561898 RepID=A0A7H9CGL9_9BACT|nr:flagellar biosynthesis protein FlhA [Candidatus Campylobacter infans]QLI05250.1 flagellar export apparatus, transmembrane gate complex, FlhA component [Candidatus Campylobacter infans]
MTPKKRGFLQLVAPYFEPILTPLMKGRSLSIVAVVMTILAIIIVPLPSGILDFFLALSISISVLIILIAIYVPKPTDLSTFPTLILIVTLFRLSLNIATTRMILSKGHEGPSAVSDIIASFGEFVVGGNFVIGIIVFCILVLINFMVITKGSTRVSEVQARFTLDAMPGKQMAIDADLNAGLIDEATARKRREDMQSEANFYGAMDGSSKFIKGDAVAGIIITIINIIGGFAIGVFQHDLAASDAASTYTILTIGDGLVSQIPGLITSTATAIIITRSSGAKQGEKNFAEGVIDQLFGQTRTLFIVGGILFLFALVPGLPTFSLGFMGLIFTAIGFVIYKVQKGDFKINESTQDISQSSSTQNASTQSQASTKPQKTDAQIAQEEQAKIDDILKVEILELDLGYGLLKLAETEIIERIRGMRRSIASTLGFRMPKIRIRDDLSLSPNDYVFKLKGVSIGTGQIYPDKFLAMDSGYVSTPIDGLPTKEPAFGLDALWIDESLKQDAILYGYTVVDPASVISTHMSELVKQNSSELLTKQEVQNLLDRLKTDYPIVVEEALKSCDIGLIYNVLGLLLKDNIPIKDMLSILDAIDSISKRGVRDAEIITEHVRSSLNRVITGLYKDSNGKLNFYILEASVQQKLVEAVTYKDGKYRVSINTAQTSALISALRNARANQSANIDGEMILCVDPSIRRFINDACANFSLNIVVLSFAEIARGTDFETLGAIEVPGF